MPVSYPRSSSSPSTPIPIIYHPFSIHSKLHLFFHTYQTHFSLHTTPPTYSLSSALHVHSPHLCMAMHGYVILHAPWFPCKYIHNPTLLYPSSLLEIMSEEDQEGCRHVTTPRRALHRLLHGRSRRRQRHREANGEC